jgi:hypothetical protein
MHNGDASGSENNCSNLQLPTKIAVPVSLLNMSIAKSAKKNQMLSLGSIRRHAYIIGRNNHTPDRWALIWWAPPVSDPKSGSTKSEDPVPPRIWSMKYRCPNKSKVQLLQIQCKVFLKPRNN